MINETYSRQRRHQLRNRAKGLCTHCPKPLAEGSKNYCKVHAQKAREYQLKRYHRLVGIRMCPQCGKRNPGKNVHCPKCRRYFHAYTLAKMAQGLCAKCYHPRGQDGSPRHCRKCLEYFQTKYKERRLALNKRGLCFRCSKPKPDNVTACLKCLEILRDTRRRNSKRLQKQKRWKPGARGRVPQWYKAKQEAPALGREGPATGSGDVGGAFMPLPGEWL